MGAKDRVGCHLEEGLGGRDQVTSRVIVIAVFKHEWACFGQVDQAVPDALSRFVIDPIQVFFVLCFEHGGGKDDEVFSVSTFLPVFL